MKRGKKIFRYKEAWNMHEGCADVVRNGWEHNVVGSSIYQVIEKIVAMRMQLNNWARSNVRIGRMRLERWRIN